MSVLKSKELRNAIRTILQRGGDVSFNEAIHIWKENDGTIKVWSFDSFGDGLIKDFPPDQEREAIEAFEKMI